MLKDGTAFSSFAVADIDAARTFYEDVLGLTVTDGPVPGLAQLQGAGNQPILVYPKPDHQPANHTVLNFGVDDLEATVRELTDRGVSFERYDTFEQDELGITRETGGGPAIAWFTDPSGNIMAVMENAPG
ncbi:MAG TPA: VOC family protein [Nocardioidaceae bacterium]|nr:VOC family protein [Nocardioidaceae bacterium]